MHLLTHLHNGVWLNAHCYKQLKRPERQQRRMQIHIYIIETAAL